MRSFPILPREVPQDPCSELEKSLYYVGPCNIRRSVRRVDPGHAYIYGSTFPLTKTLSKYCTGFHEEMLTLTLVNSYISRCSVYV